MSARTRSQLRVIRTVVDALRGAELSAWFFGGWGLDARIGRVARDHGDIEFWVERTDAERSKAVLAGEPATLGGTPDLAMSAAGMLAMKEQYPALRNGRPWRPKDQLSSFSASLTAPAC